MKLGVGVRGAGSGQRGWEEGRQAQGVEEGNEDISIM